MAAISASMVKELREKTGAGMMDSKKALVETEGDIEAAVDWLRKKGLAQAAKKADRVAAEGLVGLRTEGTKGVVAEINSETDFVARNEQFQTLVKTTTDVAFDHDGVLEAVVAAPFPGADKSVTDHLAEMVGVIGENMSLRRTAGLSVSEGVVTGYIHNGVTDGLGRMGVIVALEAGEAFDGLADLGKKIAMHIAATNPLAVSPDELDQAVVERERNVLIEQARATGKPDNIIEKMVEGRIRKFYEEVVLLHQPFVIDPDLTVGKAVEQEAAKNNTTVSVTGFVRYALGEGIEKEETDFAAEVAAAAGSS